MKKLQFFLVGMMFVVVSGCRVFDRNPQEYPSTEKQPGEDVLEENAENTSLTFISNNGFVTFSYPGDWFVTTTTPSAGNGEFGPMVESWIISNFMLEEVGTGGIAENSVKIDFEMQTVSEGFQLKEAVDCEMKSVECSAVEVNGTTFERAESVLNTGMMTVVMATQVDNTLVRMIALIQSGDRQAELRQMVDEIFSSLTINTNNLEI